MGRILGLMLRFFAPVRMSRAVCILSILVSVGLIPSPAAETASKKKRDSERVESGAVLDKIVRSWSPGQAAAQFDILSEVRQAAPVRFGTNFEFSSPRPWREPETNSQLADVAFEGVVVRNKYQASGGGKGFLEVSGKPGLAYWDNFHDGFFNGAEIFVVRYEESTARVIYEGTIKEFVSSKERLYTVDAGVEFREGDEFVLTLVAKNLPPQLRNQQARFGRPWTLQPEKAKAENPPAFGGMEIDPAHFAPAGGSRASLRVDNPGGKRLAVQQNWVGSVRPYWRSLAIGKKLRLSVWLRRVPAGTVMIDYGFGTREVSVSKDWSEFSVEFTPDKAVPPKPISSVGFSTADACSLWVDNVVMHDPEHAPFDIEPEVVERLREFRPGTLRLWGGQTNGAMGQTLDNWIAAPLEQKMAYNRNKGAEDFNGPNLPDGLRLCREVGADPWLIVSPAFSPQEWRNLIEFLAGDETTPYGAKRAASGRSQPWTAAFGRIYLEVGNETWSRLFQPWTFTGRPKDYARWSDLMFAAARSHPAFSEGKIHFVLGGWGNRIGERPHYGSEAFAASSHAKHVAYAFYAGGWDGITAPETGDADNLWFERLNFAPRNVIERLRLTAAQTASSGRIDAAPTIYEGGPGYPLPEPGSVFVEQSEVVGKSLASAVTTADVYLSATEAGYAATNFFSFGEGYNWRSHSETGDPHIAWLALEMRNRLADGPLMASRARSVPTVDIPTMESSRMNNDKKVVKERIPGVKAVPQVVIFPFSADGRTTVLILSRMLKETTEVTLNFPEALKPGAELHMLSAPTPDASNRSSYAVQIQTKPITTTGRSVSLSVPPHSISAVVVQQR